jgi:hypothetical protein
MTLSVLYAGSDVASSMLLEDGIASLTSAADGNLGTSGIKVDDPDGILLFQDLQTLVVEEDDCSLPRCFTGLVYDAKTSRGTYRDGPGRIWEFEIWDLYYLLHMQPLYAADAKRPAETGSVRMAWLLTTRGMDGFVFDNGMIAASSIVLGEADYRGKYADDVLNDMVVAGRVFFVYWDPVAEEPSLFFASPNAVLNNSTLRISNVLSDVDETTTFWGYVGGSLDAAGDDTYCEVIYIYPAGRIYRHSATTHATFFSADADMHRGAVVETDRPRTAERASELVDQFLEKHSGELDTVTVVIRLPSDKVNLIDAGMRIEVRFEHLPGFDDPGFTWTRVTRRTLTLTPGRNDFYDVQLELSTKGIDQSGGGDPGVFPHPNACSGAPTIVNNETCVTVGGTSTWTFTPTAGNALLVFRDERGSSCNGISPPTGFTTIDDGNAYHGPNTVGMMIAAKISDGTETGAVWPSGLTTTKVQVVEVNGIDIANVDSVSSAPTTTATTLTLPSVTVPSGSAVIVFGWADLGEDGPLGLSVLGGYSLVTSGGATIPHPLIESLSVASSGTSYTPTISNPSGFGGHPWDFMSAAFWCLGSDSPPGTAQWVGIDPQEVATMTGADGTTAFPFADGSLRVFVDLVEQTSKLIAQDGVAGTFTLGFTPTPTEVVTVQYQGR